MAQTGNQLRHFHAGQLAAFAGFGPLGDLDFQFFTGVQIFRRDAKATGGDLFDLCLLYTSRCV